MLKLTFAYVEDYLELLAGQRRPDGSTVSMFDPYTSPINLARYDVKIVSSLADQLLRGIALTDKQSELALRLLTKYQRQISATGLDPSPTIDSPSFRIPIRTIDRTRNLYKDDSSLVLRFPYDADLISILKKFMSSSQGSCRWDNEAKLWRLALTEWNLSWAYEFARQNQFEIDHSVADLMQLIFKAEETPYCIELGFENNSLAISNAPPSLLAYIDEKLGGMRAENLITLIDYAPILGYSISEEIKAVVAGEFDDTIYSLFTNRLTHVQRLDLTDSGREVMEMLVRYANLANRWPICIYEPDASDRLRDTMRTLFRPDEIMDTVSAKANQVLNFAGKKCVYFNKLSRNMLGDRVPLFLSTNAMLFGPDKQAVVQVSDKIVYYTATTYDKTVSNLLTQ